MPREERQETDYTGVLLIDKPLHKTSHDVVQDLRRALRMRRIGHAGTLDPLAEGLLVTCLGRATKVSQFLSDCDKTYEAEICLGLTSATLDSEGVDSTVEPVRPPDLSLLELVSILTEFTGEITQQVPAYSAVRVAGEPLYKKARRGEAVEQPTREVTVHAIELKAYEPPYMKISVDCSSGTYIRTLADDIGRRLGCGAYLSGLRRTRVGRMKIADAFTVEQVSALHERGELEPALLGYDDVLDFAGLVIADSFRSGVIQGRRPTREDIAGIEGEFAAGDTVALKSLDGLILAVGTAGVDSASLPSSNDTDDNFFSYRRVLN
jgi:tRNA pseudouridine55 synthase